MTGYHVCLLSVHQWRRHNSHPLWRLVGEFQLPHLGKHKSHLTVVAFSVFWIFYCTGNAVSSLKDQALGMLSAWKYLACHNKNLRFYLTHLCCLLERQSAASKTKAWGTNVWTHKFQTGAARVTGWLQGFCWGYLDDKKPNKNNLG